MNLNVPGTLMLLGGLLLAYAAVNNKDPREVVSMIFTGKAPTTPISQPVANPNPTTPTNPQQPSNPVWV